MKKWLIPLVGLILVLAAIAGAGFALAGNGTGTPEVGYEGEPPGDQTPILSDEGIDPNECNWIHNINACNDTLVIGPDEEDTIEPDFGENGPYLVPDRDIVCGPDQGIAITSDGRVSCLDLAEPQSGDDGNAYFSPGQPPIIDASPPAMGMIAPNLRLTFEGVEYTGVEILGAASATVSEDGMTGPIVCCGTPINSDDMEVVGNGTRHNPDGDTIVSAYRPKAGVTTDIYTLTPAQTFQVPEEPDETYTTTALWIRWIAS